VAGSKEVKGADIDKKLRVRNGYLIPDTREKCSIWETVPSNPVGKRVPCKKYSEIRGTKNIRNQRITIDY
jgi:hypothetical protein